MLLLEFLLGLRHGMHVGRGKLRALAVRRSFSRWQADLQAVVRRSLFPVSAPWCDRELSVQVVAQVAQIYGRAKLPRGVSELNPCLPGFRRPPASRSCAFM